MQVLLIIIFKLLKILALHNALQIRCQSFQIWKDNENLIEVQKEARKNREVNVAHLTTRMKNVEIEETRPPPDDIRNIDIYPTYSELTETDEVRVWLKIP